MKFSLLDKIVYPTIVTVLGGTIGGLLVLYLWAFAIGAPEAAKGTSRAINALTAVVDVLTYPLVIPFWAPMLLVLGGIAVLIGLVLHFRAGLVLKFRPISEPAEEEAAAPSIPQRIGELDRTQSRIMYALGKHSGGGVVTINFLREHGVRDSDIHIRTALEDLDRFTFISVFHGAREPRFQLISEGLRFCKDNNLT